jgi:hypothetical protein
LDTPKMSFGISNGCKFNVVNLNMFLVLFVFNRILGTSLQWVNNWVCIEIDILKEEEDDEEDETVSTISSPTTHQAAFFLGPFLSKNLGDVWI